MGGAVAVLVRFSMIKTTGAPFATEGVRSRGQSSGRPLPRMDILKEAPAATSPHMIRKSRVDGTN